MSNWNSEVSELRMGRSDQIFNKLAYDGFDGSDIARQAEHGVYGKEDSAKHLNANEARSAKPRLNANAALPLGAATEMDKVILQAITFKPSLYQDLMAAGCRAKFNLGTYMARYAKSNLAMSPNVAMDIKYQGEYSPGGQSQGDYVDVYTPIPMFWYDWHLARRQLDAAANQSSMFGGLALEAQEVRAKTIGMVNAMEATLWNGNTNIKFNDTVLTGVLTDLDVINGKSALTFSQSDPQGFLDNFQAEAIQPLLDRGYDSSNFMVYMSLNAEGRLLNQDYNPAFPTQTIRQRLMAVTPGIKEIKTNRWVIDAAFQVDGNGKIDPTSKTKATIVVIKMEPEVIDVAVESDIVVAQYANTPMGVRYAMFGSCAPRIKKDYYGKFGIQLIDVTLEP